MTYDANYNATEPLELSAIEALFTAKLGSKPKSIESPKVHASYHKIYVATTHDDRQWYLRVARPALPRTKTLNEVACLKWVRQHVPSCPVPQVLAWSVDTTEIGFEYMIIEALSGGSLADTWKSVYQDDLDQVWRMFAHVFVEIARQPWHKVGGLTVDDHSGEIVPGPVLEEVAYEYEEYIKFFKHTQFTYDELQIGGPFESMADYFAARLNRDIAIIKQHPSCSGLQALIPLIKSITDSLQGRVRHAVNSKRLILAHQDLHLGNMLYDNDKRRLSGVIDWEFSGVTAIDQWVRRNTFVYLGTSADEVERNVQAWRAKFFAAVKELDEEVYEEATHVQPVKDELVSIVGLTFWIVKCTVMGTQSDDVVQWIDRLNEKIKRYESVIEPLK